MDSKTASKLFGIPRTTLKRRIGDSTRDSMEVPVSQCWQGSNLVSNYHSKYVERHLSYNLPYQQQLTVSGNVEFVCSIRMYSKNKFFFFQA